jgi:structural maintenance of chromosome 2
VANLKAAAIKANQALKNHQRTFQDIRDQYESAQRDVEDAKAQLAASEEQKEKLLKELQDLENEISASKVFIGSVGNERIPHHKAEYDENNTELCKQSSALARFDQELQSMEDEKKKAQDDLNDTQIAIKKLQHDLDRQSSDRDVARQLVHRLLKEHDWIEDQRANFNRPNTAFDFSVQNPSECRKRLKQLEQEYEVLRKKINVKVMNMIDRYGSDCLETIHSD